MELRLIDDRIFDACEWDEDLRQEYKTYYVLATRDGGYFGPYQTQTEALNDYEKILAEGRV